MYIFSAFRSTWALIDHMRYDMKTVSVMIKLTDVCCKHMRRMVSLMSLT